MRQALHLSSQLSSFLGMDFRMRWFAIAVVLVGAGLTYLYWQIRPEVFAYRYRLHLAISIDENVSTGSSIVEVTWQCGRSYGNKHDELGPCYPSLGGQAALVDLGPRGVVATLHTGENIEPVPDGAISAVWLCGNAFGNSSTNKELPALPQLVGRRNLIPSNFPRLVWFPKPADPGTALKVTVQNIAAIIDPTARITEAYVEITRDPVAIDIPDKLPWFSELRRRQTGKIFVSRAGQFLLVHNMFVGENS
jgi:hypothetical protein